MFRRELINFLFPRAPLTQLSLIGTPGEKAPEAKKGTQGPEGGLIGNSTAISLTSTTVVNLEPAFTNHTPTTSQDKSNLRVGAWGQVGPCERCNIFRTASGGVTMTDSNRMLPACPQPITGKPFPSVQLVMKCRQPLACCATGTCAKSWVKNLGPYPYICNYAQEKWIFCCQLDHRQFKKCISKISLCNFLYTKTLPNFTLPKKEDSASLAMFFLTSPQTTS